MTNMQPSRKLLSLYSLGKLDDVMMMVLSAHMSLCPDTKVLQREIEAEHAALNLLDIEDKSDQTLPFDDAESLFNAITALPITGIMKQTKLSYMQWDQHQLPIPKVLSPLVERCQTWKKARGKLWRNSVSLYDEAYTVDFMFMESGCELPSYSYKGELNLVLNGSLRTKRKTFTQGDLLCLQDTAKLSAAKKQGCLFVSVSHVDLEKILNN
tara:strand:+ start:1158 stop:1790 length:633 start_codon:yes stop_codon:yes gene_type:complete